MPDDAPLPDEAPRPDPAPEPVQSATQDIPLPSFAVEEDTPSDVKPAVSNPPEQVIVPDEGLAEPAADAANAEPAPETFTAEAAPGASETRSGELSAAEPARDLPAFPSEVPELSNQDWIPVPRASSQDRASTRGARGNARSGLRQRALIGFAFLAPVLVIGASVYSIVWGGRERAPTQLGAIATKPAPASAPSSFPGEVDEDPTALADPRSDAGHSLEEPNQVVPEVGGADAQAPGAALPPGFEDETGAEEPAPSKPAPPKHFATVYDAAMGSCSTESVDGLSRQIIEQARCLKPNEFVPLPKRPNLIMAPNVYGYLELGARDHLLRALDSKKSQTMTINSALRTVAQQYLVSHWSLSKICGVQMATRPGESNHEIGTALDIKEAGTWRPALEAQEFKWLGASDRVHFDYKSASQTRAATDVLAFQKLWNKNHKDDAITETGRFDAATEQRLKKSPPSGFAQGASCGKAHPR